MPNYASCTLIGHLGRDPELRHTPNGDSVASFSLATNRKRKDGETTTWWRCTLFGRRGEVLCEYLRKGDPVLVSGEPYMRPWTDKTGAERMALEVDVRDFAFVGGKDAHQAPQEATGGRREHGPAPSNMGDAQAAQMAAGDLDDDIPF